MTSECLRSQRQMMCGLSFMKPYESSALVGILGSTVELPSYPARELCNSYQESCSTLIAQAPLLDMNCSQQASPGVDLFPTEVQVLLMLMNGPYQT